MLNFQESRLGLERDMGEVVSVVDSRLIENNGRNNQQENASNLLSEEVQGLREEAKESRNNNQQLQENQRRMEQRMEDGGNRANGEITKSIVSVQTQEDRWKEGVRYEQANVQKYSSVGLKREAKFEAPPP